MTKPNEIEAAVKPWPLSGYAPGHYHCTCCKCSATFEGDKRAITCLECAVIDVKKASAASARGAADEIVVRDAHIPAAPSSPAATPEVKREEIARAIIDARDSDGELLSWQPSFWSRQSAALFMADAILALFRTPPAPGNDS